MAVATGAVITGTRGSGKTTLADLLVREHPSFGRVPSITTRGPRADDRPGTYRFVSQSKFDGLQSGDELVLVGTYGVSRYGIAVADIDSVLRRGLRPLLTVAPQQAYSLVSGVHSLRWQGAFVDADDEVLEARLRADGRPAQHWDRLRRTEDRSFSIPPLTVVENNGSLSAATELMSAIFEVDRVRAG